MPDQFSGGRAIVVVHGFTIRDVMNLREIADGTYTGSAYRAAAVLQSIADRIGVLLDSEPA